MRENRMPYLEVGMTLYSLALFVHILGALALFGAMGLEWVALLNLRRVEMAEQAREWLKVFALFPRLYPLAWLAIILAGLCMTAAVWKGAGWIIVALVSGVVLGAAGGAPAWRRVRRRAVPQCVRRLPLPHR